MGYDQSLVRDVMQRNIDQHGIGYQTAMGLLDAVIDAHR